MELNAKIKMIKENMTNEGNYHEFTYLDIPCHAKRNDYGAWCGYASFPVKDFQFPSFYYDDLNIYIHGGLTYSNFKDADKTLVLGFDCAHAGDAHIPIEPYEDLIHFRNDGLLSSLETMFIDGTYRTLIFVVNEIMQMVDRVIENYGDVSRL